MASIFLDNDFIIATRSDAIPIGNGDLDLSGFDRNAGRHPGAYHVLAATESGHFVGSVNWSSRGTSQYNTTSPFNTDVGVGEYLVSQADPVIWAMGWYSPGAGSRFILNYPYYHSGRVLEEIIALGDFSYGGVDFTHCWTYQTAPPPSHSWTRPLDNMSESGTGVIPPGSITWNKTPTYTGPGVPVVATHLHARQLADVSLTVAGASAVTMTAIFTDTTDPATWVPDATYGFVPEPGKFVESYRLSSASDTVTRMDTVGTNMLLQFAAYMDYDTFDNAQLMGFKIEATGVGTSYFSVGDEGIYPNPGSSDPNEDGVDIETPGGDWATWPDDPDGTGDRPGMGGGSGSTPSPYPNVTLPDGPDEPPLLEVVNPSDPNAPSYRLPPGSLGDAPIRTVNVGRMLYVYYGGARVISYLIPAAQYAALRASSTYVGYINVATWAEVDAPATVTITLASPGYVFTAGTYTASMGRSPYLWVWAQNPDNAIDILVESGVARGVEGPTQDEIDAATTHIAGGRDPDVQSTISYANALEVATQYNTASVVTPVQAGA